MAHARLTGLVTNVAQPRSGTSAKGVDWASTTLTVLVGGVSTTEVSYDHTKVPPIPPMAAIDILVELGVYNNTPQLRYAGVWDDAKASLISDTLAAAS